MRYFKRNALPLTCPPNGHSRVARRPWTQGPLGQAGSTRRAGDGEGRLSVMPILPCQASMAHGATPAWEAQVKCDCPENFLNRCLLLAWD